MAAVVLGLLTLGCLAAFAAFWADQPDPIENADAIREISGGIVAGVVVSLGILVAEEIREGKREARIERLEQERKEDHDEVVEALADGTPIDLLAIAELERRKTEIESELSVVPVYSTAAMAAGVPNPQVQRQGLRRELAQLDATIEIAIRRSAGSA